MHLNCWDVNNLYGWTISQKLHVGRFKWVENLSQFNNDFIENYNQDSDRRYFLVVDNQYHEKLNKLHNDLLCLLKRMKQLKKL